MIKFKHENMIYYYPNKQTLEAALRATLDSQDNNIRISSSTPISNYADYIINSDDNTIIKNRAGVSMEELLDDFIPREEQDASKMKDIINKIRTGGKLDHLSMEDRILRNKH